MIKPNTIIQGDCFKILPKIKDKSVNMILTDPPTQKSWALWDYKKLHLEKLWSEYNRIIKDNGAILIFGSEPFSSYLRMENMAYYRYDLVWDKMSTTNFANAKRMPLNNFELISVFYKKQPHYNPILTDADPKKIRPVDFPYLNMSESNQLYSGVAKHYSKDYDPNKRYPTRIIRVSSRDAECNAHSRQHMAQKPVSLCKHLISMYSKKGDIVLDSFMGVGSVMAAVQNLNRKFIGIEKDRKYFKIAKNKLFPKL